MRVKKQKRNRKSVRFYSACFGFREPFKVLCDGTFVNHLLVHRRSCAGQVLSGLFGGTTKLFVTRCILAELKSLGESFSESLNAARSLLIARCDHEPRKSAASCIEEIVGENNLDHFFIGTQDADLRKKFREIPGVPVIFGLRNSLFLEQPSAYQRQFVKSTEEERLHMKESEYNILKMRENNNPVIQAATEIPDSNEASGNEVLVKRPVRRIKIIERTLGVKDKSKFKIKKAKGPNPLSCKKKNHPAQPSVAQNQEGEADKTTRKKRNRKRKRARKEGNLGEAGS